MKVGHTKMYSVIRCHDILIVKIHTNHTKSYTAHIAENAKANRQSAQPQIYRAQFTVYRASYVRDVIVIVKVHQ